jgi:hypothetical protein
VPWSRRVRGRDPAPSEAHSFSATTTMSPSTKTLASANRDAFVHPGCLPSLGMQPARHGSRPLAHVSALAEMTEEAFEGGGSVRSDDGMIVGALVARQGRR